MLCGQEHLHHSPRLGVRCSKNSLKKVWQWDPWDSVRTHDDMLDDSWLWRSEEMRKTCHLWNNGLFLCVSIILQMLASSQGLGSKELHMFFLNCAFFFFIAALVDRVVATCRQVFKLIDIDQSGSIDFEEFSIFFAKVAERQLSFLATLHLFKLRLAVWVKRQG